MTLKLVWIATCDAHTARRGCPSTTEVATGDTGEWAAMRALMSLGWAINDHGLVLCPRHIDWPPSEPPAA